MLTFPMTCDSIAFKIKKGGKRYEIPSERPRYSSQSYPANCKCTWRFVLTITTISGEFEAEETQPQVIASLNSIARCVGFIQRFALCTLDFEQVDDEEENGHE